MSGTSTHATSPRVGIALAAYEPPIEFFREQLSSIAAQSYAEWFCVIGIDGDARRLMAEPKLAPFVGDSRFVWSPNPERLGHRRNFERTIARAAELGAELIACADQDDIWHPEKIARLVASIAEAGPLSLVHSDMQMLRGERIEHESVWRASKQGVEHDRLDEILVANVVNGCTMLFDAELARRYPVIPASFGFHDHWFAAVASAHGGIHRVDEALMQYRQHGANVVGASEFDWRVRVPGRGTWRSEIDACVARWQRVRERATELASVGIRPGAAQRLMLLSRVDLGALLVLRGIALTWRSPRLSRYLVRLGIGKLASTLGLGRGRNATEAPAEDMTNV